MHELDFSILLFVMAKLRAPKDFVFYDLSFSFWRTKKYNGILLNGWSIKMWKIAKSTFCDKKIQTHQNNLAHTLSGECLSLARHFEFTRTSSHCDTISISLKYEDYRIYAVDKDINISIYFTQGVLHSYLIMYRIGSSYVFSMFVANRNFLCSNTYSK